MSAIPDNPVTMQDLMTWYTMQEDLAKLKAAEVLLRRKIFKFYFPTPSEGVNTHTLDDGYALKGDYKIDRKVDDAALVTLTPTFQEQGLKVDELIKRKPELALREYRKLEADETEVGKARLHLFDQCLIIKPSETPALEIVLPKKAAGK